MIPVLIYILCVLVLISSFVFSVGEFVAGGVILGAVAVALIVMYWSKGDKQEVVASADKFIDAGPVVLTLIVVMVFTAWSHFHAPWITAFCATMVLYSIMLLIDLSRRKGIIMGIIWFAFGLSLWISTVPVFGNGKIGLVAALIPIVLIYSIIAFTRSVRALRQKDTV